MSKEEWRDIKGYEGKYQVSNFGFVKSLQRWDNFNNRVQKRERILKQNKNRKGYMKVKLYNEEGKKTLSVHRLVAIAFIENPENKEQINHIDGNKANNRLDNLEWCTNKENQIHARKCGLSDNCRKKGKKIFQYDLQNNFIREWENIKTASVSLGICSSGISNCCKGILKSAGRYKWSYADNDEQLFVERSL